MSPFICSDGFKFSVEVPERQQIADKVKKHAEIQILVRFLLNQDFCLIFVVSPCTCSDSFIFSVHLTEIQQTADSVKKARKFKISFDFYQFIVSFLTCTVSPCIRMVKVFKAA